VKENSNAEFFYSAGGTGSDCRPAGGPASILVRCLRGQARSTRSGQAPAAGLRARLASGLPARCRCYTFQWR